jgi:hypothetical protein
VQQYQCLSGKIFCATTLSQCSHLILL